MENIDFLRGQTVARKKLKLPKVEEAKSWKGKVELVRSWKREKLKIARVENAKVERFRSWKFKSWKGKVENAKLKMQKLNHHVAGEPTW